MTFDPRQMGPSWSQFKSDRDERPEASRWAFPMMLGFSGFFGAGAGLIGYFLIGMRYSPDLLESKGFLIGCLIIGALVAMAVCYKFWHGDDDEIDYSD
jgi:hypothetical protein